MKQFYPYKSLLFLLIYLLFGLNQVCAQTISLTDSCVNSKSGCAQNLQNVDFQVAALSGFDTIATPDGKQEWHTISLNNFYDSLWLLPDFKGVGWIRINITHDESITSRVPLAMVTNLNGAAAFYFDDYKSYVAGTFSNNRAKGKYVALKTPIVFTVADSGTTSLLIKYENFNLVDSNSIDKLDYDAIEVKVKSVVRAHSTTVSKVFQIVLLASISFLTLFAVHLSLFLFYRKDHANIYFALFNLFIGIAFICFYSYFTTESLNVVYKSQLIAIYSIFLAIYSLASMLHYQFGKFNKFFWILIAAITLCILLGQFTDIPFLDFVLIVLVFVMIVDGLVLVFKAFRAKKEGATFMVIGLAFCVIALVGTIVFTANSYWNIAEFENITFSIFVFGSFILAFFSVPVSISVFLASKSGNVNKRLEKQLIEVENLSKEKQEILSTQKENLELQVTERTQELQLEKKKSDDLLLNILPQEVAEELKEKGESKAQYYDEVSVLFTDFVNFTSISEKMGVEELLAELNANFTAFDQIMEKHGLEKIKTIGDAYLAVSGLPLKNEQHAQNAVAAALDIIAFVEERKKQVPNGLGIRIGIHSGSLIAGIVGVKKFAYDIWGDTVNTAARMEQSSEPGKVNISNTTFDLVKTEFNCEHRGKLSVKGKGEMDMYFVNNK